MKRIILLISAALLLPAIARADDGDETSLSPGFMARTGVEARVKLNRNLSLQVGEELRFGNGSAMERFQTDLGVSYKLSKHFDVGLNYSLIEKYKSSASAFQPRHRLSLDFSESFKTYYWTFSAKQRFQYTHRSTQYINIYQDNPNLIGMKAKFQAKYRGFGNVKPYGYVEIRGNFNEPWGHMTSTTSSTTANSGKTYYPYKFDGYTHAYINRYRFAVGADWKLSKKIGLDFRVMADSCSDYEIDTNSDGDKLFSAQYENQMVFSACAGLTYKF